MGHKTVAIVVVTYGNPDRLSAVLDNMKWAGIPDIPVYIYEDPIPFDNRADVTRDYEVVAKRHGFKLFTAPKWGCMQGITQYAMETTNEDWIIWVPDDVLFTCGGLWNEYAGVLTYGREWVGGIQAPYWNAADLVTMGALSTKEVIFSGWQPSVPQNPFWNDRGLPRAYINLNGAGFSINRQLWKDMGGFPQETWRIDEYLGYQAWTRGYVCVTLPGQPRVHYFGGSTSRLPQGLDFHTEANWIKVLGCSVADATGRIYQQIHKLPGGQWHEMVEFFNKGGRLC